MTLTEIQPNDGYWRLVEPVWQTISIYDGPEVFLEQFRKVPLEVGHLFAAHWCQSEVRNGGLLQFFENSTGVLAPEACEAFRVIGIPEWASVLSDAIRHFAPTYPRETTRRQEILAIPPRRGRRTDWDPFHDLDERFYAWLRQEVDDRWCRVADAYAAGLGESS